MIDIVIDPQAAPRVEYGATQLVRVLHSLGIESAVVRAGTADRGRIIVGKGSGSPQSFTLRSDAQGRISIIAADDSGALYGCLELAQRISRHRKIPEELEFSDAPVFVLRGPCIGMQKTTLLPGRRVYEYPYTPELFPFFYDQSFWSEYLDFLAGLRMNSLYLWNGHPFASLVKLADYPQALEVSEEVFQQNVRMFRWIAAEADRRGIWLVQHFYNILLPKPLADRHGLDTQLSAPNPLAADYTRKSIAEFVRQYPNVGLMICLGEALVGIDHQIRWCTDVILAGVREGMKQAGLHDEPPVVLRTHATDARKVVPEALKVYRNLYTEAKFNGESLTTWEPRGVRQQLHLAMSKLGSTHMVNVHILANLEPFRYGAQRFIRKCMQAARDRLGARGLHLYPLAFWCWPDSPDKTDTPLKQWHRDWIWFEAWARYAWNPDIDEQEDHAYWVDRLMEMYGSPQAAEKILDAYNDSGECAPRILRRFGITEGNRQTLSLGMTLDQLVDPEKYRPFPELWESQSPPGERLQEYVQRDWTHQPHQGETPPQIIEEILEYSRRAVEAIDAAAAHVAKNHEEFARLRNDVHCIRAMSQHYAAKANAAMLVLRYQLSRDLADLERAGEFLAKSLEHYRALARLTENAYRFANSMQTGQRKIPVSGGVGGRPVSFHWTQLLPLYEQELADFQARLAAIRQGRACEFDESQIKPLPRARFTLLSGDAETYEVQVGACVFRDQPLVIRSLAPELAGLSGIRFSHEQARSGRYVPIEFHAAEPVQVLIGYFKSNQPGWLQPPNLETDASADDRGGVEPVIRNAATISELPPLDVHALRFDAGINRLEVRGAGSFVILGVVPQSVQIVRRDAGRRGDARPNHAEP